MSQELADLGGVYSIEAAGNVAFSRVSHESFDKSLNDLGTRAHSVNRWVDLLLFLINLMSLFQVPPDECLHTVMF